MQHSPAEASLRWLQRNSAGKSRLQTYTALLGHAYQLQNYKDSVAVVPDRRISSSLCHCSSCWWWVMLHSNVARPAHNKCSSCPKGLAFSKAEYNSGWMANAYRVMNSWSFFFLIGNWDMSHRSSPAGDTTQDRANTLSAVLEEPCGNCLSALTHDKHISNSSASEMP